MSLADQIAGSYRRAFAEVGEDVTLVRGDQRCTVKARVTGFDPAELVGAVQQGDRKVIMPAEPFAKGARPLPAEGVILIVGGKPHRIQAVDDSTRRVAGVLVAYELVVRG